MANSADPDETPRFAASHLGLHCLLRLSVQIHTVNTVGGSAPSVFAYASEKRFLLDVGLCFLFCSVLFS